MFYTYSRLGRIYSRLGHLEVYAVGYIFAPTGLRRLYIGRLHTAFTSAGITPALHRADPARPALLSWTKIVHGTVVVHGYGSSDDTEADRRCFQ